MFSGMPVRERVVGCCADLQMREGVGGYSLFGAERTGHSFQRADRDALRHYKSSSQSRVECGITPLDGLTSNPVQMEVQRVSGAMGFGRG